MGAEPKARGRRRRAIVLTLLAMALLVLHQDFWNWEQYQPLWLGFLPIGLTYHAAFSVA